jgi:hypothetical protein
MHYVYYACVVLVASIVAGAVLDSFGCPSTDAEGSAMAAAVDYGNDVILCRYDAGQSCVYGVCPLHWRMSLDLHVTYRPESSMSF